ncbi:MAG TPA: DUF4012 domain-containing protein [Candidatus Limnocylindrales bacterium]|nr:DUF4012 domain-containing protein [Candidatus Limnocylindrales bacterium]
MKRDRPRLVATEENNALPVLVIDKKGFVGSALANKLKEQFLVVLVSGKELEFHNNIIHIPFRKKTPIIPDNSYSHIFVFYNGEEEILSMLPALMTKANSSKGKVFFLTPLLNSSKSLFARLSNHLYHAMHVVVYGEVFDELISIGNMVNLFIYQARKYGRLEIPNEGIGKLYPVFINDLLAVIIASAFSQDTIDKRIFVFPRFPISEMTVARIFQKINPTLKIDFSKRKLRNPQYFIPADGKYVFKSYDLENGLRQISLSHQGGESSVPERKITDAPTQKRFSFKTIWLVIIGVFALPLAVILIAFLMGAILLSIALKQAESGKFKSASEYSKFSRNAFAASEFATQNYVVLDVVGATKSNIVQSLRSGKHVSEIGGNLFASLNTFSDIYNQSEKPITPVEFQNALSNTKNSLLKLEEMKAQNQLPQEVVKKLDSAGFMLTLFENTIDTLPTLLGFEGKKKYLVLFQNNMEIRPGGGFIGSYAIADIENGKIPQIKIHDVYDADGKLTTHVEPPYGLKRYGGVTHWFLRDSNFDVDFVTNAAASADLLMRSVGENVDGVIAIDTNFIKNILEVLGTVRVEDYKEDVSADNFYILTQKHAEDNFFPGSTQKKDFLRALLNSMIDKGSSKNNFSYLNLSKAAEKSIKEKHLLMAFSDTAIQEVFSVNNLSSTLRDIKVTGQNSFSDFFGTVDANIGANKGNYYLKRSIAQDIRVTDSGGLEATATITYENTSKKDSKFGGEYKNYLRFLLPNGADLRSIAIDGKNLEIVDAVTNSVNRSVNNALLDQEVEVESSKVGGKEVIAFFMTVPISTTKKVEIRYLPSQAVNINSSAFSYNTMLFKQPGTVEDPYKLTFSYPAKFKAISVENGAIDLGGRVIYETLLSEDREVNLKFSQK